jgi:hypothetical protein
VKFSKYHPGKFLTLGILRQWRKWKRTAVVIWNLKFTFWTYDCTGALWRIVNYMKKAYK